MKRRSFVLGAFGLAGALVAAPAFALPAPADLAPTGPSEGEPTAENAQWSPYRRRVAINRARYRRRVAINRSNYRRRVAMNRFRYRRRAAVNRYRFQRRRAIRRYYGY